MFRKKTLPEQYLHAMEDFDVRSYFQTGALPEDMPEELRAYTQKIIDTCASYAALSSSGEQKISALSDQINPHFLYNTLDSIRSEALMAGNEPIERMTACLSRFFRYSISNPNDFVTLREECLNLKDYFQIQSYRFGDRFSLDIEIQEPEALEAYVPKMMLQPLVENAFLHGLENKKHGGKIRVHHALTSKLLYIWVSDNGEGMSQDKVAQLNQKLEHPDTFKPRISRHKGIALPNIQSRIRLQFGPGYGLRINSVEQKGTDVELRLPYLTMHTFQSYKKEAR